MHQNVDSLILIENIYLDWNFAGIRNREDIYANFLCHVMPAFVDTVDTHVCRILNHSVRVRESVNTGYANPVRRACFQGCTICAKICFQTIYRSAYPYTRMIIHMFHRNPAHVISKS